VDVAVCPVELLNWALGLDLAFAFLHSLFRSCWPGDIRDDNLLGLRLPALALLLTLIPLMKEAFLPLIWPVILLIDVLAIGLAIVSASMTAIVAVLLLTLLATEFMWSICPRYGRSWTVLMIITGFSMFFSSQAFQAEDVQAGDETTPSSPGCGSCG
jgi:hypothetical protein